MGFKVGVNAVPKINIVPNSKPSSLAQGCLTFFFPRAKNSFPVGPKGQETLGRYYFYN
jgi:hypothetical protein